MTYRVNINITYTAGADSWVFEDFINGVTYEEHGALFPEITQDEFEEIKAGLINQYQNPFGDIESVQGYVGMTRNDTPEAFTIALDFDTEESYLAFYEQHMNNRTGGVLLLSTTPSSLNTANEELKGRRIVNTEDEYLDIGSILTFGRYLTKLWQTTRKPIYNVTHETIA